MIEISSGGDLERAVALVGEALGLEVETEVYMGDRIWGARRRIDVLLSKPDSERVLGIECKFQRNSGSAEEKIPLTVEDIDDWPIRGIVVVHGTGFSPSFVPFLKGAGANRGVSPSDGMAALLLPSVARTGRSRRRWC